MLRKLIVVGVLVALMVPLAAAAALAAQVVQCTNVLPCVASGDWDRVFEREGDGLRDDIRLRGGHDLVLANKYRHDRDEVSGGKGRDKINVADGDTRDTANGGRGHDTCIVDARSEFGASCAKKIIRRN